MLDTAVKLYRARFGRIMRRAVLVVIPFQALSTLILLSARNDSSVTINDNNGSLSVQRTTTSAAQIGAVYAVLFLLILASLVVCAVTTRLVADAYISEEPRAPVRTGARVPALAVLVLLVALMTLVGLALAGIPGLLALTLFSVAIPVFVLERAGIGRAIGRSISLTGSHFGRALGLTATALLIGWTLNLGLSIGLNFWAAQGADRTSVILAQGVTNAIALMLTGPYVATAFVVLYFDLRVRSEGFDVQLAMQRNDERHAAARAYGNPAAAR
jgi:hypothetical protein